MSGRATIQSDRRSDRPSAAGTLSAGDLAELLGTFQEAASRLQETHETLRSEVGRLETELREAHEQLKRARQLAALGEMAAGIAHEVRNPLGSIRLYAEILMQDLGDRPAEREVACKIAGAVSRLDAVVGDVLAFSKEVRVRAAEVDVRDLLSEAVDACSDVLRKHGVIVHCPGTGLDGLTVCCDPVLMHQALTNVIRNAAEAMAEQPAAMERGVWLTGGDRRVAGPDGRRLRMRVITIRDSGPGVPSEVLGRMFNPFFTTRHTGTGLGLAIVHRIIDAHGGRVVVENNSCTGADGAPACGATVEFLLPVSAGMEAGKRLEAA